MQDAKSAEEVVQEFLAQNGLGEGLPEMLLQAFQRGYPVSNLEPLLRHPNESVAKSAGWVLSELGKKGGDLIAISVELLSHPLDQIRADAISNLLANSDRCPPAAAWSLISRYPKETERIKEEIVNYLARAPVDLLSEAISSTSDISAQRHSLGLSLHTNLTSDGRVHKALESDDPVVRAYALSAARRLELFAQSIWRAAARSSDPVIQASGARWLRGKR